MKTSLFPRRLIGAIHSTIPVCPGCDCVMLREGWDTARPRAVCRPCGKSYYYSADGNIAMTAKLRRVAA